MAHINLLPWREELRRERMREFATMAIIGAVLGVAVVFGVNLIIDNMIENQQNRNAFIQSNIDQAKEQIREIEDLKKKKDNLIARMEVIQQLQQSRPDIVRMVEELVTTVPDGVYLTSLDHADKALKMTGKAQSNARVAAYMRNIEASDWMSIPKLGVIKTQKEKGDNTPSEFSLEANQTSPKAEGEE